jgi:hypothetical protein
LVSSSSPHACLTSFISGLIGLGPNEGSAIQEKLDGDAGDTMLNRIFQQNKTTANYITFLLDRKNDPGEVCALLPFIIPSLTCYSAVYRPVHHW